MEEWYIQLKIPIIITAIYLVTQGNGPGCGSYQHVDVLKCIINDVKKFVYSESEPTKYRANTQVQLI